MDLIQKPSSNLIKLRELYFQKAVLQSKDSFLHFIAMFAPTLVPDWLMGKHMGMLIERKEIKQDITNKSPEELEREIKHYENVVKLEKINK